jgi:hypothetical protein
LDRVCPRLHCRAYDHVTSTPLWTWTRLISPR